MFLTLKKRLSRLANFPVLPLSIIIVISIFSIVILDSISAGSESSRCFKQIVWISLGLVILVGTCLVDIDFWKRSSETLYAVCLALLIAVVAVGKVAMGAQRWLNLYFFNLQPSELMRLFLILPLSKYYSELTIENVKKTSSLILPALLTCAPVLLVLAEPDLGTAMILLFVSLSIIFISGTQVWKLVVVVVVALSTTPIIWNMLHEYQRNRILMLFSPELDPNGAGYHIIQSQIAIGSGGFWGKGLAGGTQCQLNFLPEKQTDFVFAALAEELGFVGCAALIILYAILIGYNMRVSLRAKHKFERILVFGLSSMMFFYVFVNISMICGILPVVGIPLPFFSYGGSALIVLMFCEGLIISVDMDQKIRAKNSLTIAKHIQ